VAEADIGRIVQGQKVHFTVDAFQGVTFEGAVSQVRLAPTTVQNVVTYTVLVDAPNPEDKLLPGMTANLTFEVDRADDVLLVSESALRFEPPKEGESGESRGWSGASGGSGGMGAMGASGGSRSADPRTGGSREHKGKGKGDEAEPKKQRVYVLRDEKLVPVEVEVSLSDGLRSAVTGELAEGDEVVTGVVTSTSSSTTTATNPFMPGRPGGGGGRPRM
jgi:HlyD family secretion protein